MNLFKFTLIAVLGLAATSGFARAGGRPIVVELFTSQGCSSCPPDQVRQELWCRPVGTSRPKPSQSDDANSSKLRA